MEINYDSWEKFENMWNLGRGSDKDSHDYILWVRHCFQFWCLFPRHYDFYKDDMVLLLEAATDFSADFGSLEEIQIFQFSRIDPSTGKSRYKLNDTIVDLLQEQCDSTYFRLDDIKSSISENTLHASLGDGCNVLSTLKDLCLAEKLRTLLILHEHGSPIYQVPRHLFIKLPLLRVLDFSHTNITDLPSSVGNLKHLKYLNLSWTPITKLPNPVCNLYNLQALKLRGCLKLVRLPKDIRKLKNLQQLDVDVNCLLISMPPGLGDLQKLKALPAFVVGKENGCHITELKHMNICGNFQILRLENISSAEEATEAKISTKDNIRKLQLQWTELQDGLEILENLRPPIRLQELHIVGYGGVRLPSWLGEYHPYKLVTITISDCRKCESLPSLGNIPFLKFLRISDMHAVKKIDNEFCGQKAFPKLEKLTLNAMPELEKWSGIKIGYFGYLLKLNISNCSRLTYLPNLSCLKSLLQLEISLCPLLESFPKEGLPTSLGCIVIIDCPLLKDRCHTNEGPEWGKIAHIANIRIDYQQIPHEQDVTNANGGQFEAAEKIVLRWDSNTAIPQPHSLPWDEAPDEAAEYLSAVDEILQLTEDLTLSPDGELMDRAESVLQLAMSRLEEEFRQILIRNTVPLDAGRLYRSIHKVSLSFAPNEEIGSLRSLSFASNDGETDDFESSVEDDLCVDLIHPDAVANLKEIADRMIRSGYEKECCQVYSTVRRDVLDECLSILETEKLSIEEIQRIEWGSLVEKMKWIQAVKIVLRVLLSGEKRLCEQIFEGSELIREVCFTETAKGCVIQLLNFGKVIAIARRSPEKLFGILDMYEALSDTLPDLQILFSDESGDFVCSEANTILDGLAEAAKGTFTEFEKAVQNETSRNPIQGGEIHLLTRYVMNYVKLLVNHSDTLNLLLKCSTGSPDRAAGDDDDTLYSGIESPLGRRLLLLISSLESNLEEKSKLYEDGAMQYIFLMNNIHYIGQKVKDSDLGKLLGDHWVRKHHRQVPQYAIGYLRAAWSKVLSCLKDEGIGGSGSSSSVSKVALKERFKSFNLSFEELYRNQTQWKVPDPQLREELRISISEKVLPAYRSFFSRYGSHLESRINTGKCIKYTPEDLESRLLDLFEGIPGKQRALVEIKRKKG